LAHACERGVSSRDFEETEALVTSAISDLVPKESRELALFRLQEHFQKLPPGDVARFERKPKDLALYVQAWVRSSAESFGIQLRKDPDAAERQLDEMYDRIQQGWGI
jgi:hypothetical protein